MTFNSYIDFKIRETIRNLVFIQLGMVGVLLLTGGIVFKLVYSSNSLYADDFQETLTLLIVISMICTVISVFASKFIIKRISRNKSAVIILNNFKAAYILKYLLIVLPAIFGYVFFLYYASYYFFYVSMVLIAFLATQKATLRAVNEVIKA